MFKSIFTPKYLRVILYEQGKPLDLNRLQDDQLNQLRKAILQHFKTNPQGSLVYDCLVYEHHSWFTKSRGTEFNLECFLKDREQLSGQRAIRFPKHLLDTIVNKKLTILPEDTVYRKWKHPIQVEFRLP